MVLAVCMCMWVLVPSSAEALVGPAQASGWELHVSVAVCRWGFCGPFTRSVTVVGAMSCPASCGEPTHPAPSAALTSASFPVPFLPQPQPVRPTPVPLPAFKTPPASTTLPAPAEETKKEISAEYIADQKAVDAALLKALSPELKGYLGTRFTLRDGDRPHLMKF